MNNYYGKEEKIKEKLKNKEIIFGSSGRVRVRLWFGPKIDHFFGFDLFQV